MRTHLESISLVGRRSTRLSTELVAVEARLDAEALGVVYRCEAIDELLVSGREAVVGREIGRPEGAAKKRVSGGEGGRGGRGKQQRTLRQYEEECASGGW
jgi:hypothetical protein